MDPKNEALPGVWGNRGIRPFISGEQGNKSLKLKRTGEQSKGTWNIEKQDFDFGEQWKMPIVFTGTREQVPARPHLLWEGLKNVVSKQKCIDYIERKSI